MIKEHAELIQKKSQERKIDLANITSYPEYYVLVEEFEKMLDSLDKIDNLNFESKVSVEVQALANKLAKDKIIRFLSDMKAYAIKAKDVRDSSYD